MDKKELNMAGLMNQTNNKSELLNAFRAAFGPRSGETEHTAAHRIFNSEPTANGTHVCLTSKNGSEL